MSNLYRAVELEEGVLVQYVGTHVLAWPCECAPTIGFVEADDLLSICKSFLQAQDLFDAYRMVEGCDLYDTTLKRARWFFARMEAV